MWQDYVVAVANLLFSYSLVFQIRRGFIEKKGVIALQTSFLTAVGLSALSIVYFSYGLYISTIISLFSMVMWIILSFQRAVYKGG
jgi:hypothetical protein